MAKGLGEGARAHGSLLAGEIYGAGGAAGVLAVTADCNPVALLAMEVCRSVSA